MHSLGNASGWYDGQYPFAVHTIEEKQGARQRRQRYPFLEGVCGPAARGSEDFCGEQLAEEDAKGDDNDRDPVQCRFG